MMDDGRALDVESEIREEPATIEVPIVDPVVSEEIELAVRVETDKRVVVTTDSDKLDSMNEV